ncbi:MAG: LTA synthase family protein, partial [Planctomycetes bacterium]|nr:LTA synthase family protein [Planctomycetota bacterium]
MIAYLFSAMSLVQILSSPDGPGFLTSLAPFFTRPMPILGTLAVLGAFWVVLWALTHRARLSAAILLVIWLPPAIANAAKLASLDLPLLPPDIYRALEVARVFHGDFVRPSGWGKFLLLAAVAAPLLAAFFLLPAPKGRFRTRIATGLAAAAFLGSFFFPATNVFAHFPNSFTSYSWDSRHTCDRNGLVVFLAMQCRHLSVQEPAGYTAEAMDRIVAELPMPTGQTSELHPDVIVVLSESFIDPTLFPGVEYDADPVPTLHQLQRDFGRLDLVSPVFGGMTCNAEFEFLTGLNMAFFAESMGAWVDPIRRPVPSLASILRGHGYHAVSGHAMGGFHNDMQVQPLLGFERYLPGSEWTHRDKIDTWRVTDAACTQELIQWSREVPRPWFLCMNTMEGHGSYDRAKYNGASCGIRFTKPLSEKSRELLTTYSYGARNADRALAALIDAFRDAKNPTLIVFYGDHLPELGQDLLAFRETGWSLPGQRSSDLALRTVPCVLWNNFGKRLPAFDAPIGMSRM